MPFDIKYVTPSGEIITRTGLTSCQFTYKQGTKVCIKYFASLRIKSSSNFEEVEPDEDYDFAFTGSVTGELNNMANKVGVNWG